MKIIAHRGASLIAPENTLAAFRKSQQLGAKAIELDVHFSLDQEIIVHHEYSLGHPDSGKGLIFEITAAEIQKADAGSWKDSAFKGERIPLLKSVFEEFGNTFEYELELKACSLDFLQAVLKLVHQFGLEKNIEYTSPHLAVLAKLKSMDQKIKTGVFCAPYPSWMPAHLGNKILLETMTLLSANVAHLPLAIASDELINSLHQKNFTVHLADCNSVAEIKTAYKLNVDQFSTNDVILALKK